MLLEVQLDYRAVELRGLLACCILPRSCRCYSPMATAAAGA